MISIQKSKNGKTLVRILNSKKIELKSYKFATIAEADAFALGYVTAISKFILNSETVKNKKS